MINFLLNCYSPLFPIFIHMPHILQMQRLRFTNSRSTTRHLKSWQSLKWNLVTSQYPNFTSKLTNSRYVFRKNCFNFINKKVQYLFAWIIFPILKLKSNNDKLSRIFPKKIRYLIDFLRKWLKFDYSVCCKKSFPSVYSNV